MVTGSCFFVETSSTRFLIDCGMFQGSSGNDRLNHEVFPNNLGNIDFLLLTHAHIDHSGRIPKFYKDGFRGTVYSTKATKELCAIMLPDSGHIQEFEAEWTNRKNMRAGRELIEPFYTVKDAYDSLSLFKDVKYDVAVYPSTDVKVKFRDAGHILGSAILEVWITEEGKELKLVFSGDLGNKGMPILRDPTIIDGADYLVIESTYGNRMHESKNKVEIFVNEITGAFERGGNVIIPSFAVGRTQEVIYYMNRHLDDFTGIISKLHDFPVVIDSPLAISATEVFRRNPDCYDDEARSYIENGDNPLDFPGLRFTRTADESRALNDIKESMIIISASGMCDAGRIKHHLKHNLWRRDSTVIFVGYQAEGTLGRRLVDGDKKVTIFGEEIAVNAKIVMIDGFSGHADQKGLIEWIGSFRKKPSGIFVVHGEEEAALAFSDLVKHNHGIKTIIPERYDTYDPVNF